MPDTGTAQPQERSKRSSVPVGEILRGRLASNYWRPNDQLPTEKQLAAELNVCAATVQRYLLELQREGLIVGRRGKGRFVSSIKQRPRTENIGAVLFDSRHLGHSTMAQMVAGIGEVAAEAKQNLKIFVVNELTADSRGTAMPLISTAGRSELSGSPAAFGVDGLIVLTQRIAPEIVQQLSKYMPVVTSHTVPLPQVPGIIVDNAAGAFNAVRHLLELEHRKIALITKDAADTVGRAMREGARLAFSSLANAGPGEEVRTYTAAEFAQEEGYRLGQQLVQEDDRPTAVICGDDTLARGMLQAIEEAGLSIPKDISFVAWHDTLAGKAPVPITSVFIDTYEAGVRLAKRLMQCIENPEKHFENQYLPAKLIVRESTAKLHAAATRK